MTKTKLPFWATVLTIICVIILCALGTWQVQRLQWKEGLLSDIEQAYQVDPDTYLIGSEQLMDAYDQNRLALRGTIIGHYLVNKSFKLGPRPRDGKQGYHLYTPLKLLDDGIVLVNRGWIPATANMPVAPTGTLRVKGIIKKPDPANRFTPPNRPIDNEWYTIDFAQIAQEKALPNLAPYVLYIEGKSTEGLPIPVGEKPELYNNHKFYAIFWFMMAGMMVVFYILLFIVPAKVRSQ